MTSRTSHRLPAAPPPAVMEEILRDLPHREAQAMEAVFALRAASQQLDNALTEWLGDTAGSPARFQILMLLKAAKGSGVPHKEIVAALGVTRATVSGLMAALEREGVVKSSVGCDDRRTLLATLTTKGEAAVSKAREINTTRLSAVFASLSSAELTTFTALLLRVREGVADGVNAAPTKPRRRRLGVE